MTQRLPFAAVVGQEAAKRALLLAAVEPLLGGVLLRGDKGSAKTTLARGLAELLPGDAPFVELPLGASEDRVLGSLDLTELLANAQPVFRPGLLSAAHSGVLYVDEINLLADHLVDALLDVAVSGINRVERDGVSHTHPARFVLVASMNPEEGELRPQLLDRFGLAVDVQAPADVASRVEAVRRQLAADWSAVADGYDALTEDFRAQIGRARDLGVAVPDHVLQVASALALEVGAEGLRADLMLVRAARANAALDGRDRVTTDDVRRVAALVLAHRRRRRPFDTPGIEQEELDDAFARALATDPLNANGKASYEPGAAGGRPRDRTALASALDGAGSGDASAGDGSTTAPRPEPGSDSGPAQGLSNGGSAPVDRLDRASEGLAGHLTLPQVTTVGQRGLSGRGVTVDSHRGRKIRASTTDVGPADPLASAIALASRRAVHGDPSAHPQPDDLRTVVREQQSATLIVFALDASGSMGVEHRMAVTKAAVLGLLTDAYRRRCRVAVVTFRDDEAVTVLRPTGSVEVARARLEELRTGGTSPIAAGLREAARLVDASARGQHAVIVLVTDGRATGSGMASRDAIKDAIDTAAGLVRRGIGLVVLDSEHGPVRLGFARQLAAESGATLLALDDLDPPSEAVVPQR
ncbi:MAG: VWA domain-containing protein [Acidimicrobiales bacterium]|nr:VWA domain-containing protein [Acidimicrobiales bacterium]